MLSLTLQLGYWKLVISRKSRISRLFLNRVSSRLSHCGIRDFKIQHCMEARPLFKTFKSNCDFKHLKEAAVNWLPCVFDAFFKLVLCPPEYAPVLLLNRFELKPTIRNSSHLSASLRRKCSDWRCLQNQNGVENTLGTTKYSFSLFCTKSYFVLIEGRVASLPRRRS